MSEVTFNIQTICSVISVLISFALFFLNNNYKIELSQSSYNSSSEVHLLNAPKYCVYVHNNANYILTSVEKVLNIMGLERTAFNFGDQLNNDCSLFWLYDYPFTLDFNFKHLEYHQKINHIPGNIGLISKSELGTTVNSKYIPKSFINSKDLRKYAELHPEKRFVQKFKSNRGVKLKKASEMNFTDTGSYSNYFGQEFIENPLLFDGHKFDFGVYVVITSVNPLRFYHYNDNLMLRFCFNPYDHNNFDDIHTYVIDDHHITAGVFPAVKQYYDQSYSYKAAMNAYFTEQGHDMNKVWSQVDDCIRQVILSRNDYFMDALDDYKSKFSFFELYRFDMILDEALNLYVLEVNQSPNLYASNKYITNRKMYENVIYSTLNLVGVGSPLKRSSFESMNTDTELIINDPRKVSVLPEVCTKALCDSCASTKCELCRKCMSKTQKYDRIVSLQEQTSHGPYKRLFPVSNLETLGSIKFEDLSPADQLHSKWFMEMCKINNDFC